MDLIENIINQLKEFRQEAKESSREVEKRLDSIDVNLAIHMLRTQQNEDAINGVKADLEPIKEQRAGAKVSSKWAVKVLAGLTAVVTIATKIVGIW